MQPKHPNDLPTAMGSSIAFGIAGAAVTRDRRQKHVALIYRAHNSKMMLLHLGWHHYLCHQEWDANYHWLEIVGIDIELQETFADWAVVVAAASPGHPIPYSVLFRPGRNFDPNGRFINLSDGSGLTCATFLLALFSDFQIPLVDISSWPTSRPGDFTWLRKILKELRKQIAFATLPKFEWLEQVKQRHRLKRYRPEEVFVSGALYAGTPLSFSIVADEGAKILPSIPD